MFLTFKQAWIIGDEFQNATPNQMKMMLTRIGDDSKMIVTGDLEQHDRGYEQNGLKDFLERIEKSKQFSNDIGVVRFGHKDIERHPIIDQVLELYREG